MAAANFEYRVKRPNPFSLPNMVGPAHEWGTMPNTSSRHQALRRHRPVKWNATPSTSTSNKAFQCGTRTPAELFEIGIRDATTFLPAVLCFLKQPRQNGDFACENQYPCPAQRSAEKRLALFPGFVLPPPDWQGAHSTPKSSKAGLEPEDSGESSLSLK